MNSSVKQGLSFSQSPVPYYGVMIVSFVIWVVIHHVLSPRLFGWLSNTYKQLDWQRKMEWDSRIMSTIHATVVSILATFAVIYEPEMWTHIFEFNGVLSSTSLSITVGYALCDFISMPFYYSGASYYTHMVHHTATASAFFFAVHWNTFVAFCVFRLLSEYSTPFTNFRWHFRKMGKPQNSKRIWWSTFLFCVFFFIFRLFWILPFWYISYHIWGTEYHLKHTEGKQYINILWLVEPGLLDLLNIYWSKNVIQLFTKLFVGKKWYNKEI